MKKPNDFEEEFQDIVQEIPLNQLRSYRATAPSGSVLFLPRVKRYGAEVVWEGRVHIQGAMGPVRITEESLRAIDAPPEWLKKSKEFQAYLQSQFPVLEVPDRKALEANVDDDDDEG